MPRLSRRSMLAGALAASASAGAARPVPGPAGVAATAPAPAPDPVTLYRKLHLRTDDGLLFWWLQGPKFGQVGATLTPLFTSSIGTIQRVRVRPDGGFDLTQLELILLFDIETGRPLDRWRNPYTGESIPVAFAPVGPVTTRYRRDNSRDLPTDIGGTPLESTATTYPPIIVGDDVFQRDEAVARVFTPGRATPFVVNDIAIYHGSLANLADPAVTMGEATVSFAEVTDWQRWMRMGDLQGTLTSRLSGRKLRRYEDLPAAWRARLAEVAPRIAADPVGALDGPAPRFER